MNTEKSISSRLLEAVPAKILKENFNLEGWNQKEAISEVVENNNQTIIRNFVFDNFGYLHQHVYVFDLNNPIPANWSPDRRFLYSTVNNGNDRIFNIIFRIKYKLFNPAAGAEQELFFVIDKTVNVSDYVSRFYIEPTRGKITITRFADKNEAIDNLLEKIIDNN